MVNLPAQILDRNSHSPTLFDLFLLSDSSICSTVAFPPLQNSDDAVVLVSIDFLSKSKKDASFHHKAYDYSCPDWDDLSDHLRDVPWEEIFKVCAS